MLRFLSSAIDDALDILYEPNVVFSHFLGSASMIWFLFFRFLVLPLLVLYFSSFSCLVFSFLSFPFSFVHFGVFSFLSFFFFFFSLFLFSNQLASVVRMRSDSYYVQYRYAW